MDIRDDLWPLLVGDLLGSGAFRKTFACKLRPDLVIKEEQLTGHFANVAEWRTWEDCRHAPKLRRWLAPVIAISPQGRYLIQERTEPVKMEELPKSMPRFLTDFKVQNYGRLRGQIVCHDYGLTLTTFNLQRRKVDWWDAKTT